MQSDEGADHIKPGGNEMRGGHSTCRSSADYQDVTDFLADLRSGCHVKRSPPMALSANRFTDLKMIICAMRLRLLCLRVGPVYAKHAQIGLMRSMAKDLASSSIQTQPVNPALDDGS